MPSRKNWNCHVTCAHDDRRLKPSPELLSAGDGENVSDTIYLDPKIHFQKILGFGGAMTEASASNLLLLPEEAANSLVEAYYGKQSGNGYIFCRIHMNSCDFSLGNYSCVFEESDVELSSFQIERDLRYTIPWLRKIQKLAGEELKILVSPWSPPPWMKTNGQMNEGGKLRPEYAAAWAQHYVKFIEAYKAEGFDIWGLTIQNEPAATQSWDSCLYSPEEERDFVRDHLGPALEKAGLLEEVKIIVWDHNRDEMVHRGSVIYGDPEASRYVWGTGFHWYANSCFNNTRVHHEAWPEKHLIFTEGCQEYGTHMNSWKPAERYATSIIHDLNNWTEAWIDWNLFLNEAGGPNHVGNLCSAPILIDRETKNPLYQPSFYYLAHFSRFIKPGARRTLCSATFDDLPILAATNPNGKNVIIVLNDSDSERTFKLACSGQTNVITLPARSICSLKEV